MSFFLTVVLEPGLPEDTRLLHGAQGQAAGKLWPANAFALLPVQVPQVSLCGSPGIWLLSEVCAILMIGEKGKFVTVMREKKQREL